MADDTWQLEAINEQFNVLETGTTPCQKIPSTDFTTLMMKVTDIKNFHMKMETKTNNNPRVISAEIMKYSDGKEIKLSFAVIVTNIKIKGNLSKMPIFVIMSGGKKKFIDMNLTVFNSWDAFLKNNDLPSCQFCFPVSGQYTSTKLKIDFASSPAAIRENVSFFWKGLGFVLAVGTVTASFFYQIAPMNHNKVDSLLGIVNDFVPGITGYVQNILRGVNLVQKFKNGDFVSLTPDLWKFLNYLNDEFGEVISSALKKVRATLIKIYNWIKHKFVSFFRTASETAQHQFMAVVCKVDTEIITVDSEAEELLEASRNNVQAVTVDASVIHGRASIENDSRYVNSIFKNAKREGELESGSKSNENLNQRTLDLLSISNSVAENLAKTTLRDAQDIFEAVSKIVKEEFKNKIQMYTKMKAAAAAAAGHKIDLDVFNINMDIKGDVKEHYWQEAVKIVVDPRHVYSIKWTTEELVNQRKLTILEIGKKTEDDVPGLYRCVGINGAGVFGSNDFIKALKDIKVDLNEDMLVINETSSMISIRNEDLMIAVKQELNSDNTSEGVVFIDRIEM